MINFYLSIPRFPFMREFTSQETASSIIDAQRRNYTNISIPTYWLRSFKVLRYINKIFTNTNIQYIL